MNTEQTDLNFSFFVNCDALKEAEKTFVLEASSDQRATIAKRLELISLDSLNVKAVVSRKSGDLVHLHCTCSADLFQSCVITARSLESKLNFTFEREFSASVTTCFGDQPEPAWEAESKGPDIDDQAPEPPDPMSDGGFDLGEMVTEQLSLEIDPFPRAADAWFEGISSAGGKEGGTGGSANPFAVLEQLKKKL